MGTNNAPCVIKSVKGKIENRIPSILEEIRRFEANTAPALRTLADYREIIGNVLSRKGKEFNDGGASGNFRLNIETIVVNADLLLPRLYTTQYGVVIGGEIIFNIFEVKHFVRGRGVSALMFCY